jgi:anti-sigma B factor antagonist
MHGHLEQVESPHQYFVSGCTSDAAVTDRRSGDIAVVEVTGPLTVDKAAPVFRDHVRALLDHGQRKFSVNLAHVDDIDSYGLGALAAAYNWIAQSSGRIALCAAAPRVKRTLTRLRLDSVFTLFEREEDALQALASRA